MPAKNKSLKPELVSPAGDWPSLIAAVEAGADSVYFGVKTFNMRNLATNFDILELPKLMQFLKRNKKKGYLALNTIVMNEDLVKVKKILTAAKKAGVDAVILCDMAVFHIAKELGLRVHLSTQVSVSNKQAVLFFAKLGVRRIVLARECSLKDIKAIASYISKKHVRCQVEIFVHGAMCISVSGRCFLSGYSFNKSANKGQCIQPCRRQYRIYDMDEEAEYLLGKDYILSAKDLCTIDFLDRLIASGASAFKIEGRMKSAEYVRVATSVYRRGIDAALSKRLTAALRRSLKNELESIYNRGFSDGFLFSVPSGKISRGTQHTREKIFVGEVKHFFKRISVAEVSIIDHPLNIGDTVIFLGKNTPAREAKVLQMQHEYQPRKTSVRGEQIGVKVPFPVRPHDKVFIWRKKKNS